MLDDRVNRRMKSGHVAMALVVAALPFAYLDAPTARAQNIMRTPNLNIDTRIPTINPNVAPRIDPNIAGRANVVTGVDRTPPTTSTARIQRINPNSTMPHAHYSPNLHPVFDADRGSNGECTSKPATSGDGGGAGKSAQKKGSSSPRSNAVQAGINLRSFSNQLVAEIDSTLTDEQADELARRHGLVRIESQNLPLIGATIGLFRITDNRPAD